MSARGVKFQFRTGESVLCFEPDSSKAKVLYDARVLDTSTTHDKSGHKQPAYLIHFLRWNSSWDRVVPESYLLKNTDDNRELMRKLSLITQRTHRNKARSKKIEKILKRHFEKRGGAARHDVTDGSDKGSSSGDSTGSDSGDNLNSSAGSDDEEEISGNGSDEDEEDKAQDKEEMSAEENPGSSSDEEEAEELASEPVKLELPRALKDVLERDWMLVKSKNKLLNLPATPNVICILETYVKDYALSTVSASAERQSVRNTRSVDTATSLETNVRLRKELVDGLRVIFDFTLPLVLLYNTERTQYEMLVQSAVHQPPGTSPAKTRKRPESPRVATRSPSRSSARRPPDVATDDDEELEIVFKTDPTPATDRLRQRQSSPRGESVSRRRKAATVRTATDDSVSLEPVDTATTPRRPTRRTSREAAAAAPQHVAVKEEPQPYSTDLSSSMPPPLLKSVFGSVASSSRASSPERSLPMLTAAVVSAPPPGAIGDVLAWKLVPDTMWYQTPSLPSLVYGAHHLLRLFVRLPEILDQMLIPRLKLTHLVRHLELFVQYMSDHSSELFPESAYVAN